MTPEEKALLENLSTLVKENNDMLRSMQKRGRISFGLRILYWVIIIGISIGAFYFIQPYADLIRGLGGTPTPGHNYSQDIQQLLQQ